MPLFFGACFFSCYYEPPEGGPLDEEDANACYELIDSYQGQLRPLQNISTGCSEIV